MRLIRGRRQPRGIVPCFFAHAGQSLVAEPRRSGFFYGSGKKAILILIIIFIYSKEEPNAAGKSGEAG